MFQPGARGLCAVSLGSRAPPVPTPRAHAAQQGSAQARRAGERPGQVRADAAGRGLQQPGCCSHSPGAQGLDAPLPRGQALRVPSAQDGLRATPPCSATAPPHASRSRGTLGGTAINRGRHFRRPFRTATRPPEAGATRGREAAPPPPTLAPPTRLSPVSAEPAAPGSLGVWRLFPR